MRHLSLILCAALLLFCAADAHARNAGRVVVVQSYNPEYVWCQTINQGIKEALRSTGVDIQIMYLDAKRRPAPEDIAKRAEETLDKIRAADPALVITVDDAAQQYLAQPHLTGADQPQVIFCGVNAPPARYGFPAPNVSGVRERWHFREGFALLKKIAPRLKSVALLLDSSESSDFVLEDMEADQRQNGPFALRVAGVVRAKTFQEWQRAVRLYQKKASALAPGLYHSLVDETTGKVVPSEKVSAWTNSVNRLPTLGFTDAVKDHGHLCGVLESGHEQGFLAGSMARQVLERGLQAGALPVRINQVGIILVNLKTAEKLGVSIPFEIIAAAAMVIQ